MHFGKKSLQPHKTTKQTLRLELWDMVSHSSNSSSEAKSWKVSPVGSWASASGNGFSTVSSLGGNMPIRAPKWCDPNCSPSFLACFCSFELLVVEAVLRLQMDVFFPSFRGGLGFDAFRQFILPHLLGCGMQFLSEFLGESILNCFSPLCTEFCITRFLRSSY